MAVSSLFLVISSLLVHLLSHVHASGYYTVLYNASARSYTLVSGNDSNGVSWGYYDDSNMNETGWATSSISTSNLFPSDIQSYAAGYLEGATTQPLIYDFHEMFNALYSNSSSINLDITQWFETHISWLESQLEGDLDSFWESIALVMAQLRGLVSGYNKYAPTGQGLSFTQMFMLNSGGDLMDVMMSLNTSTRSELFLDHCSALILPIFDGGKLVDLFTGHTTWNQYNSMLRIYKYYTFNTTYGSTFNYFSKASVDSTSYSQFFSSYPSFLFSGDDYYITSNGLAVIETTFTIFNSKLYQFVNPERGVMTWMRATVANRLATSGDEWASIFSSYNSGTYNNQWMVVDYKLMNGELQDNLLWVVEQIPGAIQSGDMTDTLRTQGYWPSYNIPYFTPIYGASGYHDMAWQYGPQYVYNASARANIFRRDYVKVNTTDDMKDLMQYNDWRNDPLSLGNPSYSISSRFDLLNTTDAQLTGGIDSKVTSVGLFLQGQTWAISGPTHEQQPVFMWSDWTDSPHFGQPEEFNFDWVLL